MKGKQFKNAKQGLQEKERIKQLLRYNRLSIMAYT